MSITLSNRTNQRQILSRNSDCRDTEDLFNTMVHKRGKNKYRYVDNRGRDIRGQVKTMIQKLEGNVFANSDDLSYCSKIILTSLEYSHVSKFIEEWYVRFGGLEFFKEKVYQKPIDHPTYLISITFGEIRYCSGSELKLESLIRSKISELDNFPNVQKFLGLDNDFKLNIDLTLTDPKFFNNRNFTDDVHFILEVILPNGIGSINKKGCIVGPFDDIQIALPGGKMMGNESCRDAILREIYEELDMEIPPNKIAYAFKWGDIAMFISDIG